VGDRECATRAYGGKLSGHQGHYGGGYGCRSNDGGVHSAGGRGKGGGHCQVGQGGQWLWHASSEGYVVA
jgi:hypothetical protein